MRHQSIHSFHMNTVTLCIPKDWENCIPNDWSEQDNALVLQLGVSALTVLKAKDFEVNDGVDKVFSTLKQIMTSDLEGLRHENTALRQEREQLSQQVIRHESEMKNAEDSLRLRLGQHEDSRLREHTATLRTSVGNLEQQLRSSTASLELLMRTNSELQAQKETLQAERDSCRQQLEASQCEKGSNQRGKDHEQATLQTLQGSGLFVRDTSKGNHNLYFHDKLVSKDMIYKTEEGGHPSYTTNTAAVLLSFEDKCYRHSNKLGAQIEKFHEIRAAMQKGRRADCFVWYSTTSIPCRQHKRRYIEYEQLEDGRFCVTGWLGASDVSAEELTAFVQEVIDQQECLAHLKRTLPLENEMIQELASLGDQTMQLAKAQLEAVDGMTRAMKDLETQRDGMRYSALSLLFRQYSTLEDLRLLSKNDSSLHDSIVSLENEKRREADKFIKNKNEFHQLKFDLSCKRQRSDEGIREE